MNARNMFVRSQYLALLISEHKDYPLSLEIEVDYETGITVSTFEDIGIDAISIPKGDMPEYCMDEFEYNVHGTLYYALQAWAKEVMSRPGNDHIQQAILRQPYDIMLASQKPYNSDSVVPGKILVAALEEEPLIYIYRPANESTLDIEVFTRITDSDTFVNMSVNGSILGTDPVLDDLKITSIDMGYTTYFDMHEILSKTMMYCLEDLSDDIIQIGQMVSNNTCSKQLLSDLKKLITAILEE